MQNDPIPCDYAIRPITKLHKQFHDAVLQATTLAKIYGINNSPAFDIKDDYAHFNILLYVDFEDFDKQQLTGYLVIDHVLYNFITISFDIALLFPVLDEITFDQLRKGISCADVLSYISKREKLIIQFSSHLYKNFYLPDKCYYNCSVCDSTYKINDEIGQPFFHFSFIHSLKSIDIPNSLALTFHLTKTETYAPLTTSDCFCILLAQESDNLDYSPIKVLRWIPQKIADALNYFHQYVSVLPTIELCHRRLNSDIGNYLCKARAKWQIIKTWAELTNCNLSSNFFFQLGYIDYQESKKLYQFMIHNDSRILFAEKHGSNITILGGIKYLLSSGYMIPNCFKHINII